jgi:PAS domain S-box-containing protein
VSKKILYDCDDRFSVEIIVRCGVRPPFGLPLKNVSETAVNEATQSCAEKTLAHRYEALFRVSHAVGVYRDPKELFRVLANELRGAVDFAFVGLFLYNDATNTFENPALETLHGRGIVIPSDFPPHETITWWIYHNQQPVVISSRENETRFPRMMEIYKQHGVESACLLPLTTARRRLGSLGFGEERPRKYSEEEVRYLSLVADQVALAVDNALREQEQAQSEEQLRKQKAHFEKLFELAPEAIVLRDVDNRVLRANREFSKLFGFTVEEALGRNISDLIVPDGAWDESEKLREALRCGERVDAELLRKRKDGKRLTVSFVAAPVMVDGGSPEIYGIYRDITERKKADEALRRSEAYLSEGQRLSHTGSWARCVSTGEIYFSLESYRIFGLDPDTGMTVDILLNRVHPEDRPKLEGIITRAAETATDFESDYRIVRDDGSIRHIHVLGHPVRNAAGNLSEFVGTLMDVTEQLNSRKALEDAFVEINRLKDQLFEENIALRQEIDETSMFDEIVGKSAALQKVLKELETVGPTESTVLIHGETGTGKELVARAIHNLSARKSNAFVKVNCAAIPTGLLESELFGHEKGAFTGAIAQRIGRFELAQHGTVFLDEVGEIPLELQPKLLRVLQEREFERLGSSRTMRTNARLIAATNQDLLTMVGEHRFRSDLFYRLNVFPIHVPALRERPEDIPLLVRYFAELFSRRMKKSIETIPAETMTALIAYDWPGNVRELQNVVERAVILSRHGVLRIPASDLTTAKNPSSVREEPQSSPKRIRSTVPALTREQVLEALKEARGRVGGSNGAAARLGLKRTTLIAQMKKLAIDPRTVMTNS